MIKRIRPVTRTQRIEGEIQRLVSQVLSERPEFMGLDGTWFLPLDVYETERDIVLEAEVPGIEAADLRISLHANTVEIRGLKREDLAGQRATLPAPGAGVGRLPPDSVPALRHRDRRAPRPCWRTAS